MSYYARIQDGEVQEVRQFDTIEGRFHESLTWIECPETVEEGYQYDSDTGEFTEPTTTTPTLSKAQEIKIDRIKERANSVLSETDWYVVRKQETGESIPQSVIDHRAEVRLLSDEFESDVNALESVSEVRDYAFEYPEPPEP
jgi:hypothetical protein